MKFNNQLILITFFCFWLAGFLIETFQEIVGLFLILTIGIIHGANDVLIIKKNNPQKFSWVSIILKYVFLILLFGFFYFFSPKLFLIIFIALSAYHFGEQHWLEDKREILFKERLFAFFYGGFLLSLFLLLNFMESQEIIYEITKAKVPLKAFQVVLIFCSILLLLLGVFLYKRRLGVSERLWRELLILAILAAIFEYSNIVWGFAIYFIVWHSIPSIRSQIVYLYSDISKKSIYKYFSNSFLYWFVSICGLMFLIFIFQDQKKLLLSILFPFIATLTFPHAFVIKAMFNKKK
jgi:Brp/Blh family beta-carotene 15,15'-monooxygenase